MEAKEDNTGEIPAQSEEYAAQPPDLVVDSSEEEEEEEDDEEEEEQVQEPDAHQFHEDITFDALLYSHVVVNCGRHEVHAPVVSTLMLMAVIGMSPATFFVGFGFGLPVFWLAQRCLAK
jgi:hypothetical protein